MMKWILGVALIGILLCSLWYYLTFSRAASYVVLNRNFILKVNEHSVPGEILEGRWGAVITRRDPGHSHSWILVYAGDIDQVANMGSVVDCGDWVAPRLPILLMTAKYPPCTMQGTRNHKGLIARWRSEEFNALDGSIVSIEFRKNR